MIVIYEFMFKAKNLNKMRSNSEKHDKHMLSRVKQ